MAKLNSVHQLLLLALVFSMTKVTHGQGKLYVQLAEYNDISNDTTTKCIQLCVTTSPSGFPRCNLNTTTGTATATINTRTKKSYPGPYEYEFKYIEWEDNSELSATVWKLPSGLSCDTSAPTNNTYHGEAGMIIPRLEELKTRYIVSDKWKLKVITKLVCDNPGCLLPCVSRDDSTGHYTCHDDGNYKCSENWFNAHENCTTFCNETSSAYKCRKNGSRVCNPDHFGRDCDIFCDRNASAYKCRINGSRVCNPDHFGRDCDIFCDRNASAYKCRINGSRVCNPDHFGRDCDIFCDRNATNYKCDEEGRKTCLPNWYNKNCEQFCNNSEGNYACGNEGHRVCLLHWYGENCIKYCNNSATRYKCNDKGDKVCLRDWYGSDCSKFCDDSDKQFKCNLDGDKICLKNWYGKNCTIFCNNSDTHYKCNVKGDRICLKDWYGPECLKFCDNNNEKFKCNTNGDKICMPNWYGKKCTIFCNNTAALLDGEIVRYFCDTNGRKKCTENRYGPQCNLRCTAVMAEPLETTDIGLYYCEIEEGIQQKYVRCPKGWKNTNCSCQIVNEYVQKYKTKCAESNGKGLLCSSDSKKPSNFNEGDARMQKGSRVDASDVKLYGGLFGTLLLMLIITTIVVVYISLKKKTQATSTSPIYENPRAMTRIFAREFNRAEMTFTIDDYIRRRESNADELGYDNEGMMVENPLYDSNMRAVAPFEPVTSSTVSPVTSSTVSSDEVFAMSNTAV